MTAQQLSWGILVFTLVFAVPASSFAQAPQPKEIQEIQQEIQAAQRQIIEAFRGLRGRGPLPQDGWVPFGGNLGPFQGSGSTQVRWGGMSFSKAPAVLMDQLDRKLDEGVVIYQVEKDSPAAKAGLKTNDILLKVAGKAVPNSLEKLHREVLQGVEPNKAVDLTVLRKGKEQVVQGAVLPHAVLSEGNTGGFGGIGGFGIPPGGIIVPGIQGADGGAQVGGIQIQAQAEVNQNGKREAIETRINNNQMTRVLRKEGLTITATGARNADKFVPDSIAIETNGKTNNYTKVDDVPEEYRATVTNLLQNPGRIRIQALPGVTP